MADTIVVENVSGFTSGNESLWGPYWSDISTGVIIAQQDATTLIMSRTTDKGATWTESDFLTSVDCRGCAAFYDKELDDTGTLVYFVTTDDDNNDLVFRTIDVADGSFGTQKTIDASFTVEASDNRIFIVKCEGGNLLMGAVNTDPGVCYRSTDGGANWTSRTTPWVDEADDHVIGFPVDVDDGDACVIFWDSSASAISIKMYDDSENTWTETAIVSDFNDDSAHINMDGIRRISDKHVLFGAHSDDDTTGDDFQTWDLTVDSIASPTVTAKTNIFTNQGESAQAAMVINQQNDDLYMVIMEGGTWISEVDVVRYKSDDGMGTWDGGTTLQEDGQDDFRRSQGGRSIGDAGGRIMYSWFNDDLVDIFVNENTDIEIAAVVAGGGGLRNPTAGPMTLRTPMGAR